MREILEEELPGVFVSTSSETLPEIFEFERFSTTVANAVLSPLVSGYVERLEQRLEDGGYEGDLLILHSGGGVMTGKLVRRFAGRIAASGIAAGAIACRHIAGLCGFENAIGLDMGGTSTDISLVHDGEMRTTNEWAVEYGHPICFPSIEILTIGAGGGSLAWIDPAGSLRNGPQSAGADPGPGVLPPRRGGADEHGRQRGPGPPGRRAGRRRGDARRGRRVRRGRPHRRAALARRHRDRARDPARRERQHGRRGATDLHPPRIRPARVRARRVRRRRRAARCGAGARSSASRRSSCRRNPGITSALGCLLVDVRHDLSEMYLRNIDDASPEEIDAEFRTLEDEGRARLTAEGVPEDRMSFQRTIAMRYLGQWRSLSVEIPEGPVDMTALVAQFHEEHEREFAYKREDGAPVEIYQLALRAVGITPKPELTRHEPEPGAALPDPVTRRPVHFDEEDDAVDTPVFDRESLKAGTTLEGPAIVQQLDSTIVVPPGVTAEVDPQLIIRMTIAPEDLS